LDGLKGELTDPEETRMKITIASLLLMSLLALHLPSPANGARKQLPATQAQLSSRPAAIESVRSRSVIPTPRRIGRALEKGIVGASWVVNGLAGMSIWSAAILFQEVKHRIR
jgi:hypothetical protein